MVRDMAMLIPTDLLVGIVNLNGLEKVTVI
jgi:hypothetical protein